MGKHGLKICFRVDSSFEIGSGHTMRCITLALTLQKQYNADCYFITRPLDGNMDAAIRQNGFRVLSLRVTRDVSYGDHPNAPKHAFWLNANWELDAELTRSYLCEIDADILIVDHYALDKEWERLLAELKNLEIVILDDLADRPHIGQLLVDYTVNRKNNDYSELVNKNCKLLTGFRYVILRDEFSHGRKRPNVASGSKTNIFVNMGGVDSNNQTQNLMEALSAIGDRDDIKFLIVTGSQYRYSLALAEYMKDNFVDYEIFKNVKNICQIMRSSDLAISAMGSTTWELMSQGVPCLLLPIAENQERHLREIERNNFAEVIIDASKSRIVEKTKYFIQNVTRRRFLSAKSFKTIDAKGATRVANALVSLRNVESSNII